VPNFYRKPFGPGWALAGDAGLHKDPCLALGICDALRDVEWLASAIADGLSGVRPMQAALAAYELRRNEASSRDYDDNITMARFTPFRPEVLGLRAAVRNQPQQATAFTKAVQSREPSAGHGGSGVYCTVAFRICHASPSRLRLKIHSRF